MPDLTPPSLPWEPQPGRSASRPRLGISACLLGQEVRWDGGHKRDAFLVETLGRLVEWVPVCPEVELGLGTPRPPIQLQRQGKEVRLLQPATGDNLTAAMAAYAENRIESFVGLNLCGYVFKARSPTCGVWDVEVSGESPARDGRGLFAEAVMKRFPDLPVIDEVRLAEPEAREEFLNRVFALHGLRREEPARL